MVIAVYNGFIRGLIELVLLAMLIATQWPLATVNEGIQRITASIIRFGLDWRSSPRQAAVNPAEQRDIAKTTEELFTGW